MSTQETAHYAQAGWLIGCSHACPTTNYPHAQYTDTHTRPFIRSPVHMGTRLTFSKPPPPGLDSFRFLTKAPSPCTCTTYLSPPPLAKELPLPDKEKKKIPEPREVLHMRASFPFPSTSASAQALRFLLLIKSCHEKYLQNVSYILCTLSPSSTQSEREGERRVEERKAAPDPFPQTYTLLLTVTYRRAWYVRTRCVLCYAIGNQKNERTLLCKRRS